MILYFYERAAMPTTRWNSFAAVAAAYTIYTRKVRSRGRGYDKACFLLEGVAVDSKSLEETYTLGV